MMAAILVVGTVLVLVIAIAASLAETRRREAALADIASRLGGASDTTTASGTSHGVRVAFRYATRGSGKSSQPWTEIDAELPSKYPLAIYVRRHGRSDWSQIQRGEMIDVIVGD